VLRAPELEAGLQVESHQRRAEGQNSLPRPAGHASLNAAQGKVGRDLQQSSTPTAWPIQSWPKVKACF